MSLRRTLLSAAVAFALLSACVLRPRYREVVVPEGAARQSLDGQQVVLRVVDVETGAPVPGARVLAMGARSRLNATSDEQGLLTVTVSKALMDENPLVEVVLPKGVRGYRLEPVPQSSVPEGDVSGPPAPGSGAEAPEAPAELAADAGTDADAGM